MYPEDLKYHTEHTWAKVDGSSAKIGITFHAQDALGDIVYIELPSEGDEVAQGEPMGEVESTKTVSKIYSPLSGNVTAVNQEIVDAPEILNENPYEKGWLIEINISNTEEINNLLDAAKYEASLEK